MPVEPRPKRLTSRDRAEVEASVLADLVENGPSVFSAIQARLRPSIAEQLIRDALGVLIDRGRATCEVKQFSDTRVVGGVERRYHFMAKEYAAAKGTVPAAKRAQVPGKPASTEASEAKRARHAAWQALVLADIEANGPSRFREVADRLLGKVEENGVKRSLRALVLDGRVRVERRAVETTVSHGDRKQRTSFVANLYSAAPEDF